LRFHFEQYEIGKAFFAETPRRAEPGDSAADDHYRHALGALRGGKRCAIANAVTQWKRVVNESTGNRTGTRFRRQPD
jgi:hypothetical protein